MKTIQHTFSPAYERAEKKESIITRFFNWCGSQEESRFGWLATIVTGHGCIITPITLFFVMIAGNNFVFWGMVIGAMAMALIVNLAALPTKITIPVFFLSVLIDLVVIFNCIALL